MSEEQQDAKPSIDQQLPEGIKKSLECWASKKSTRPLPEPKVKEASLDSVEGPLPYRVEVGLLHNEGPKDSGGAKLFYSYYAKKDASAKERPITFVFNGGPGSSSVWLHLGVMGPQMVDVDEKGTPVSANPGLIDNAHSFLAFTDLVFIDPVGTGFSKADEKEKAKDFWGVKGDKESVARFIYDFLCEKKRWSSPRYMSGESYGTTRASALASHCYERYGVSFDGVVLISLALNFRTLFWGPPQDGDDLSFALYLPTYAATSWYHKILADREQKLSLDELLKEVEAYSLGAYLQALTLGTSLSEEKRAEVAKQLSLYTGLKEDHILESNLRLDLEDYVMHAVPRQRIGRLDSRFLMDPHSSKHIQKAVPGGYVDPSFDVLYGAYTSAINSFIREDMGFESDDVYEILSFEVNRSWVFQENKNEPKIPQLGHELTKAMLSNPRMRVFVAAGIYDFATPHFAADYTVNHLGLGRDMHPRVTQRRYEAGHMMYIEKESREKFFNDIKAFFEG